MELEDLTVIIEPRLKVSLEEILSNYSKAEQIDIIYRHQNGRIKQLYHYRKKRLSLSLTWYENGQLETSGIYHPGKEEYVQWSWSRDGRLESEAYFVHGELRIIQHSASKAYYFQFPAEDMK